jgi:ketosteroid isomerase-like protein
MGIQDGLPLAIADDSPRALRDAVQMLLDIEAIRLTKHTYFRCLDTGNFEELEALFHPDVTVHFKGGTYEWKLRGRDEYLKALRKSFHSRSVGHHNGHHPEIRVSSATEATGVWYLADQMWILDYDAYTVGTAIYWDRYEKIDGRWLIRDTKYERIFELNEKIETEPRFSAHYLGRCGAKIEG